MKHSRLPVGLTFSMLVAAASLGVFVVAWNTAPMERRGLELLVHVAAVLCLIWSMSHYVLRLASKGGEASKIQKDLDGVLTITAIVTGLTVAIGVTYVLVAEVLARTLYFEFERSLWHVNVWPMGVLDLGLVALSIYLGFRHTKHLPLMTLVFWLFVLGGLWAVLRWIPAAEELAVVAGITQTVWTHWAGVFALYLGVVVAAFVMLQGIGRQRWRNAAWPDDLWKLKQHPPEWPGFRSSVGVLGVVMMIVSCVHVQLPHTFVAAMLGSISLFFVIGRQWEDSLADVALGLMALSIVSFCMLGSAQARYIESSALAMAFNRAMIGLALMTGVYHWLAQVWRQQLDEGKPWTTAGKLVRPAQRVGYICASFCALLCMHNACWPKLPGATGLDDATARWVWGIGGHLLALATISYSTLVTRKATLGWLVMIVLGSMVTFVIMRIPGTEYGRRWATHWPAILAMISPVFILAAGGCARSQRFKPFFESVFLTGMLLIPMTALFGLILRSRLHTPLNVPPMTFGGLMVCYLVASFWPGPRRFLIPSGLCAVILTIQLLSRF